MSRRFIWGLTGIIVVVLIAFSAVSLAVLTALNRAETASRERSAESRTQAVAAVLGETQQFQECIVQLLLIPQDERQRLSDAQILRLCPPLTDTGPREGPSAPDPDATATPEPTPTPTPEPTATPEPEPAPTAAVRQAPALAPVVPFRPPVIAPPPPPPAPPRQPAPVEDRPGNRPPHAGNGRPDGPPGQERRGR